jgi:hypothetical protein
MSKKKPMSDSITYFSDPWTISNKYVIHVLHRKGKQNERQHLTLGELQLGLKFSAVFATNNSVGSKTQSTVIKVPTSISGNVRFVLMREKAKPLDFPNIVSLDWMATGSTSSSAATWAGEL